MPAAPAANALRASATVSPPAATTASTTNPRFAAAAAKSAVDVSSSRQLMGLSANNSRDLTSDHGQRAGIQPENSGSEAHNRVATLSNAAQRAAGIWISYHRCARGRIRSLKPKGPHPLEEPACQEGTAIGFVSARPISSTQSGPEHHEPRTLTQTRRARSTAVPTWILESLYVVTASVVHWLSIIQTSKNHALP